jgi:beta-lactamase class D
VVTKVMLMKRALRRLPLVLAAVLATAGIAGCDGFGPGAKPAFNSDRLENAIDAGFGGVGTCIEVLDSQTGAKLYRYGSHGVCEHPLPPCATFEIPNLLIGLDAGVVTPATVFRWDRSAQPVSFWRRDFDTATAFKEGVEWWDRRLARLTGQQALRDGLRALRYGNAKTGGPPDGFWLGPASGGELAITTAQQAGFISRLAKGDLKVKPASAAYIQTLMQDETRGGVSLTDKVGSCASQPDQSRHVTWWVGRLKSAQHDYAFAATLEGSSEDTLPGAELAERGKRAFAEAGMWPAAS